MTISVLILWDSPAPPPAADGLVYRWSGHADTDAVCGLLSYVEAHGERLRRKYLAWLHELGESSVGGRRLIDRLALGGGCSFWWMTLLAEKSPWKSPAIIDALRLFALEEIFVRERPQMVRFVGGNPGLHEAIGGLCSNLSIAYVGKPTARSGMSWLNPAHIYRNLPHTLQALVSVTRYCKARWALRQSLVAEWFGGDAAIFFCSYFIHLDPGLCANGRFYSRQWEQLPELLQDNGLRTNWIQHYLRSSVVPDTQVANRWVLEFNRRGDTQGAHAFLDSYLSWRVLARALHAWIRLNLVSRRLGAVRAAFRPRDARFSLWPLMRRDWLASLRGAVAIANTLWVELFDEALRRLPRQERGLYLCENQAWERAMVHAWRKHGHGQLIAVAHSTVRFWDLRYFSDGRTFRSRAANAVPQPDRIALNGKAAVDAFHGMDYPRERIVECEALRYGYLNGLQVSQAARGTRSTGTRILLLGDHLSSGTTKMLELLSAAAPHAPADNTYIVKPHPNCPVRTQDYPSLRLSLVTEPLAEILHDFDVAYASNGTSAAVDAYLAGLPVIVMLDENDLNFSPLRGHSGVRFVATAVELAEALQRSAQIATGAAERAQFFFLDPQLPRWRRLLGLPAAGAA